MEFNRYFVLKHHAEKLNMDKVNEFIKEEIKSKNIYNKNEYITTCISTYKDIAKLKGKWCIRSYRKSYITNYGNLIHIVNNFGDYLKVNRLEIKKETVLNINLDKSAIIRFNLEKEWYYRDTTLIKENLLKLYEECKIWKNILDNYL